MNRTDTLPAVQIVEADLVRPAQARTVVELLNAYALDPMGQGKPLADDVQTVLAQRLREHPTTLIFLAYHDSTPVGIAVCFRGFSTFTARPLVNIHDLAVLPAYRGRGIGRQLLAAVEEKAVQLDCCKITLEVGQDNRTALGLYQAVGFRQTMAAGEAGGALFLTKRIP